MRWAATFAVSVTLFAVVPMVARAADPNGPSISSTVSCVRPADEAAAWLPEMLRRLERHETRKKVLEDCRILHDAKGNVFLATRWHVRWGVFRGEFKLHRIDLQRSKRPIANFVLGYAAGYIAITDPTGDDPVGDGVPMLFVEGGGGGSSTWDANIQIVRLTPSPVDVTPTDYGQVVSAARDVDGVHYLVAFDHRWTVVYYPGSGGGYVSAPAILAWRSGRYEPICRERADLLRALYEAPKPEVYRVNLLYYLAFTMRDAFFLAQSGETEKALDLATDAIEEARRRGPDWPEWEEKLATEFYWPAISEIEAELLPAFRAALLGRDAPCPLSALGPPEFPPSRHKARLVPIPWTNDKDIR